MARKKRSPAKKKAAKRSSTRKATATKKKAPKKKVAAKKKAPANKKKKAPAQQRASARELAVQRAEAFFDSSLERAKRLAGQTRRTAREQTGRMSDYMRKDFAQTKKDFEQLAEVVDVGVEKSQKDLRAFTAKTRHRTRKIADRLGATVGKTTQKVLDEAESGLKELANRIKKR